MAATEEKIGRFIVETSEKDIPPEAITSAKLGSFDCIGTMLAGVSSPPGKIITKLIREAGGTPETTVLGTGLRTTPVLGALANGTLAHAQDYDDFGGGKGKWGHPSTILLPPLISLGERMGASGKDILNAYVIGFKVGSAISFGCRYAQGEGGFHNTSLYGTMAATAACARLLKLNVEQTIMALGTAGSMASGILQNFGTYTKALHAGLVGQNSVMACLLAQDGWKATDRVFESRVGFLHAYIGKDKYDLEAIQNYIDKRPLSNEVTIKKYPCCGDNHCVLDSLLYLLKEHSIDFEDIDRVDVYGMSAFTTVVFNPEPAYGYQGKYSIQYNIATAMLDKHIDIDSFTDEKLNRPQFRKALNKVSVHIISPLDPHFQPAFREYPVTIALKDGRTFHKATNHSSMHGTPADPLTEEELFGKFKSNAVLSLPMSSVTQVCDLWWNMDKMANISDGLKTVAGKTSV
jgi:2-methylcitrate dehydratase PrpD